MTHNHQRSNDVDLDNIRIYTQPHPQPQKIKKKTYEISFQMLNNSNLNTDRLLNRKKKKLRQQTKDNQ